MILSFDDKNRILSIVFQFDKYYIKKCTDSLILSLDEHYHSNPYLHYINIVLFLYQNTSHQTIYERIIVIFNNRIVKKLNNIFILKRKLLK